jgi:hypothetical protein
MFAGRLTQAAVRALDWLALKTLPPDNLPAHQITGRRGEEEAYFYLRRHGYTIISRNFRSLLYRGEDAQFARFQTCRGGGGSREAA